MIALSFPRRRGENDSGLEVQRRSIIFAKDANIAIFAVEENGRSPAPPLKYDSDMCLFEKQPHFYASVLLAA